MLPLLLFLGCATTTPSGSASVRLLQATLEPDTWAAVPTVDGFDFPVGPPDADGWRLGRGYGVKGHLGLDYNARGACDDDLGLPVHAAADGWVLLAEDVEGGWGNVVQLVHRLPDGALVQTQYGHLDRVDVTVGDVVLRGQEIGTVGNAHGQYCAHLHFEVRTEPDHGIGPGYGTPGEVWMDPAGFIDARRPEQGD